MDLNLFCETLICKNVKRNRYIVTGIFFAYTVFAGPYSIPRPYLQTRNVDVFCTCSGTTGLIVCDLVGKCRNFMSEDVASVHFSKYRYNEVWW